MGEFLGQGANESSGLVHEYMERAARARALGDYKLGLHLFLAAYGQAVDANGTVSAEGMSALKEAWALALELKERSLAEYIFEKMEPSLSAPEAKACSESLQGLTLDKLEEYGFSRKDLEDVSEYIAQELRGEGPGIPFASEAFSGFSMLAGLPGGGSAMTFTARAASEGKDNAHDESQADAKAAAIVPAANTAPDAPKKPAITDGSAFSGAPSAASPVIEFMPQNLRYSDLAGYANAIRQAKSLGVGQARDPRYEQLIRELNARHGLAEPPSFDPIVITAAVREDASRFATATAGEIGLPVFRMYVEDNPQGMQALCMSVQQTGSFTFNRKTGQFEGRGILVLEDIDLWEIPYVSEDGEEGMPPFIAMQISRSVREVYNFIRTAVDDPNVTVLCTAESDVNLSPFFYDLLEPYKTIDIQLPTAGERASIWNEIVNDHPSLSGVSVAMLVKNSANMARYDMYMVAAETLDEAYRQDLLSGQYHPVRAARLLERIASFQPLDSEEYKALEEAVIADFRNDLAHLDDILDS